MRRTLLLSVFALWLTPCTALAAGKNDDLLAEYLSALSNRDLARLESLLGQEFQYDFFQGSARTTLSRADELKSLQKLLEEASIQIEEYSRDAKASDSSHAKFNVHFKESSKGLRSFFFSSALAMNETLTAVIKGGKIVKIVEAKSRIANTLSFGSLKAIYSKTTIIESADNGPETTFRLIDTSGRRLLLTKKVSNRGAYFETTYYLPGDRKIRNVLY